MTRLLLLPGANSTPTFLRQPRLHLDIISARRTSRTIENCDDRPIDVMGAAATGLVRRVIVSLTGKAPYKAYFGAEESKAPHYDLAHRMRYIQTRALPRLSLRPRRANPNHIARVAPKPVEPWSERHPSVPWVAMVSVIAAPAMLILMRKTPKMQD